MGFQFSAANPLRKLKAYWRSLKNFVDTAVSIFFASGYTLETLMEKAKRRSFIREVLADIDMLIDGAFALMQYSA